MVSGVSTARAQCPSTGPGGQADSYWTGTIGGAGFVSAPADDTGFHVGSSTSSVSFVAQGSKLYAFDNTRTGANSPLWSTVGIGGNIMNFPSPVPLKDGSEAIFVAATDGFVYRVDAASGAVVWSRDTRRSGFSTDQVIATPTVELWNFANSNFQATFSQDVIYVVTRAQGTYSSSRNRVLAFNADGTPAWPAAFNGNYAYAMDFGSDGCALDYGANVLYCGTNQPTRYQNSLWAISSLDGSLVWAMPAGLIRNRPQLSNGRLYVGQYGGFNPDGSLSGAGLAAYNPASGAQYWNMAVSSANITRNVWAEFRKNPNGSPGYANMILLVDSSGTLHGISDSGANSAGAAQRAWPPLTLPAEPITSLPAVSYLLGKAYVGTQLGHVWQIDLSLGQAEASATVGSGTVFDPTLDVQGGAMDINRLVVGNLAQLRRYCLPWIGGWAGTSSAPNFSVSGGCNLDSDCNAADPPNGCYTSKCSSYDATKDGTCYALPKANGTACADGNCGSATLSAGATCQAGVCTALPSALASCTCTTTGDRACPVGQVCCNGGCKDLNNDKCNCGACGKACSEYCSGGCDTDPYHCVQGICQRMTATVIAASAADLQATYSLVNSTTQLPELGGVTSISYPAPTDPTNYLNFPVLAADYATCAAPPVAGASQVDRHQWVEIFQNPTLDPGDVVPDTTPFAIAGVTGNRSSIFTLETNALSACEIDCAEPEDDCSAMCSGFCSAFVACPTTCSACYSNSPALLWDPAAGDRTTPGARISTFTSTHGAIFDDGTGGFRIPELNQGAVGPALPYGSTFTVAPANAVSGALFNIYAGNWLQNGAVSQLRFTYPSTWSESTFYQTPLNTATNKNWRVQAIAYGILGGYHAADPQPVTGHGLGFGLPCTVNSDCPYPDAQTCHFFQCLPRCGGSITCGLGQFCASGACICSSSTQCPAGTACDSSTGACHCTADSQCALGGGAAISCINPGATTGYCGWCKGGPDGGFCFSTPGSSGATAGFGMAMLYVGYNPQDSSGVTHPTIDLVCEHDFVPTVNAINSGGKDCTQLPQPFSSIDLSDPKNFAPTGVEATPRKIKSLSADAVLGDLYIEVEDANGQDEILVLYANDFAIRNIHEAWLDQKAAQLCGTFNCSGANPPSCKFGQTCNAQGYCQCANNSQCSPISSCVNGVCIPNATFADEGKLAAEGWTRILRLGLPTNEGQLINPGFEDGFFPPWTVALTGGAQAQITTTRHSGSNGFFIGSQPGSGVGTAKLSRTFTVSSVGKSQLSFWVNRKATNTFTLTWQQAWIQDSGGNTVVTVYPQGAYSDGTNVFHFYPTDVSAFAGQTLTLVFETSNDSNSLDSEFTVVDDLVLTNEGVFNEIPMLR